MSERAPTDEVSEKKRKKEGFIARHRKALVATVALIAGGGGFFAQQETDQVADGQRIETTQAQDEVSPNALSAADEFIREHNDVIEGVYAASESEEDAAQEQYDLAITTLAEKYGVSDMEVHEAVLMKALGQSTPEVLPESNDRVITSITG